MHHVLWRSSQTKPRRTNVSLVPKRYFPMNPHLVIFLPGEPPALDLLQPSFLRCSVEEMGLETRNNETSLPSDEFCNFPFKLRNQIHWDCVEDDNDRGLVCNTNHQEEGGSEILNSDDTSTFQLCGRCSEPCGGMSKYSYTGFPLNNQAGSNKDVGVQSWSDCQKLCQQLDGCKFFNYDASKKDCSLVYGVGGRKEETQNKIHFGPKFCPGDYDYT